MRRVKDGTATAMVQSCHPNQCCDCAIAYEKGFGSNFDGLFIPLGAKKKCYKPSSSKDEARLHQFGRKDALCSLHGICITCGRRMSSDVLIADCVDLENLSASDCSRHTVQAARSHTRRQAAVSMCRRISQTLRSYLLCKRNIGQDEN